MAERAKDQRNAEFDKLDILIKKHENLLPTVMKSQDMVDLYWKCYAYGDELKPHIEFLDGIMLSSTREIAPSCVENVYELIERQEKALNQLETKRSDVKDLIDKGKIILENPDKPKFLEEHVQRIEVGWDETKEKGLARLNLLNDTKAAWEGYADGQIKIADHFDKCEVETNKIKKRFNLEAAMEDLAIRQDIFKNTKTDIFDMWHQINSDFKTICITLPDDKKQLLQKELNAIEEKLNLVDLFDKKVKKTEDFVKALQNFDSSLKSIDSWMQCAAKELGEIKTVSHTLSPEDRVTRSMELQEDVSAKYSIIVKNIEIELNLLPQGDKVPQDAQDFKDELKRIKEYVEDLQAKIVKECNLYSMDIKYMAEYKTGIKEFLPWIKSAEKASQEGLAKPNNLAEAESLFSKVKSFETSCIAYMKLLNAANESANKMSSHIDADNEAVGFKNRYNKVKAVADDWVKKVEKLVQEWKLLDTTVTDLNAWVSKDRSVEGENQFSLEKMESTLGELKNIFKLKEQLVNNL